MTKRVCVAKGDNASPEVVVPTVGILEGMNLDIEFTWVETGDETAAVLLEDGGTAAWYALIPSGSVT